MVSVVDLKNRATERLEAYREDSRALPALTHARYIKPVPLARHQPKATRGAYALRKHKPHQMHTQHRATCVLVLQWLIKRLDIATRQCVFVNPKHNIRRTIYIPEIARHTGLCERTITRAMDSLTRSQYVLRTVIGKGNQRYHYYLSEQLFRDLKLDISLRVLSNRLKGLTSKALRESQKKTPLTPKANHSAPQVSAAHKPFEKPAADTGKPTDAQRAIAAEFLAKMRGKPPPG